MKNKISKILGVALSLAMLASMLVVGTPASAGTLAYTTETLPSTVTVNFVDYAVSADGNTIYGVVGSGVVYKSTNGGDSWVTRTVTGTGNFSKVAIAPDDANVVATYNGTGVWISTNGASTGEADSWNNAGAPGVVVVANDLAISSSVSGTRQVTVAGATAGGGAAIATLNLGGTVATWTNIVNAGVPAIGVINGATSPVFAIKYSPNYVSDRLLVAIAQDTVSGNITINLFRFTTSTAGLWNAAAGFTDFTGASLSTGLIAGAVGALLTADLTLAPTYTGTDSAARNAFVGIDTGATGDIYQIKDATSKAILGANRVRSVAFNGTNLVAGRADSNVTYRSSDMLASTPTVTSTTQFQRPSGGVGTVVTNTLVAWAGANVVAATLGNESAFSRSKDNGATYQDISQFNTGVGVIIDIAVAADGSQWYMITTNATDTDVNVWKKTGTVWERLMTIIAPVTATFTLRPAPENKNVLFLVNNGTTNLYFTDDGGDKNWVIRIANEAVIDLAVESASVLYYAYAGGNVRKSTNGGFLWNDPGVNIALFGTPFSIKSMGTNLVLLTSTGGRVAYSTNGGTTYSSVSLTGGGSMQAASGNLSSGTYIYAAPGAGNTLGAGATNVYRFLIGSVAPDNVFKAIGPSATATETFTGLVLRGGILYAHTQDAAGIGGRLFRSLNPAEAGETSVVFSAINTGATLATSPDLTLAGGRNSNLQISTSTAGNVLWGIDADAGISEEAGDSATVTNDEIYSFTDTLTAAPVQTGPAADAVIAVNPVSGNTFSVTFNWNRPSLATDYTMQVALDDKFTQVIATTTFGTVTGVPVGFDPAVSPVASTLGAGVVLNPGTKYFWRVRTVNPLISPWSAARAFTTASLDKPFGIAGPETGSTGVSTRPILSWSTYTGAKWYEVTLSEDPSFAIPEWSHNVNNLVYGVIESETLKYNTTYYWRVRGVTADPFVQGTKVITPAGPWVVGAFTTMAEPVAPEKETVIVKEQAPPQVIQLPPVTIEKEVPAPIPSWMLLTIIVIGAILVIALIVLIVRTRRVA